MKRQNRASEEPANKSQPLDDTDYWLLSILSISHGLDAPFPVSEGAYNINAIGCGAMGDLVLESYPHM